MKSIAPIALVCVCALLSSCRQRHIKTARITVPQMRNEACVVVISNALRQVHGVMAERIEYDVAGRTVTVPYDSLKLARKNIEFGIVRAGFATEETVETGNGPVTKRIPGDPNAVLKLPPECRPLVQ